MAQLVLTDAHGVELKSIKLFDSGAQATQSLGIATIYTNDLQPVNPNVDGGNATVAIKATGGSGDTITVTAQLYHGPDFGYGEDKAVGTLASNGGVLEYDLRLANWWGLLSYENRIRFKLVRSSGTGTATITAIGHWK